MSEEVQKGHILATSEVGKMKNGRSIFLVIMTGGQQYKCFDSAINGMADKDVEFTVKESEWNGKTEYIMNLAGASKPAGAVGAGGPRRFGKSPEELAFLEKDARARTRTMRESYVKDVLVEIVRGASAMKVPIDISPTGIGNWISTAADCLENRSTKSEPINGAGYNRNTAPNKEIKDDDIPF